MSATKNRSFLFSPSFAGACVLGAAFVAGVSLQTRALPAPAPMTVEPAKIGLLDIGKLMNSLEELKARNDAVQARGKSLQDKLSQLDGQIKAIEAELKDVIPATDVKRRTEKFAEKFELRATLEARAKAYQQLINLENGEILSELYVKAQKAAGEFAQREGLDLVLIDDRAIKLPPNGTDKEYNEVIQSKRIVFAREGMDITEGLLTMMNNQYAATLNKPSN